MSEKFIKTKQTLNQGKGTSKVLEVFIVILSAFSPTVHSLCGRSLKVVTASLFPVWDHFPVSGGSKPELIGKFLYTFVLICLRAT